MSDACRSDRRGRCRHTGLLSRCLGGTLVWCGMVSNGPRRQARRSRTRTYSRSGADQARRHGTLDRTLAATLAPARRRHGYRCWSRDLHGGPVLLEQPSPSHPATNSLIPSVNESSHDVALAMVQAQAAQTEPLADIIRPVSTAGACPVVEPGHSPPHAIAAAARRTVPTFTVRDVARTLDQYLGMCAIELRGRDAAGSVFVFDVVAPERDTVRQRTPSSQCCV